MVIDHSPYPLAGLAFPFHRAFIQEPCVVWLNRMWLLGAKGLVHIGHRVIQLEALVVSQETTMTPLSRWWRLIARAA
jgi:hypothetical protein